MLLFSVDKEIIVVTMLRWCCCFQCIKRLLLLFSATAVPVLTVSITSQPLVENCDWVYAVEATFIAVVILSAFGSILSFAGSIIGCMGVCCASSEVRRLNVPCTLQYCLLSIDKKQCSVKMYLKCYLILLSCALHGMLWTIVEKKTLQRKIKRVKQYLINNLFSVPS